MRLRSLIQLLEATRAAHHQQTPLGENGAVIAERNLTLLLSELAA